MCAIIVLTWKNIIINILSLVKKYKLGTLLRINDGFSIVNNNGYRKNILIGKYLGAFCVWKGYFIFSNNTLYHCVHV